MAKADGVMADVEMKAFDSCFRIDQEERANAQRLFRLAARDVAGFDVYAGQIAQLLGDDRPLLVGVFECLFHVAAADGILHRAEEDFLRAVAMKFGLSEREFTATRRLFVGSADDPYGILDIDPGAGDEAIKGRHRELVKKHHPDQLASRGVPEDFRALADRKLAAINAAYDAIQKERGRNRRT